MLGLHKHQPGSLIELPDCYIIFNQVVIQYGKAIREMDYVVIGPNGIFIIEVKNNKGDISGTENDETWTQIFDAPTTLRRIRNPVKQVKSASLIFKQVLKEKSISPWLLPVVIYSHPNCTLMNSDCSIPVLRLSELTNYILTFKPEEKLKHIESTLEFLIRLQKKDKLYHPETIKHLIKKTITNPRKNKSVPALYFMHDFVTDRVNDIMNYKRPVSKLDVSLIKENTIKKKTNIKEKISKSNIKNKLNKAKPTHTDMSKYFDSDIEPILDDLFSLRSHIFNDDYETTINNNDLFNAFSMGTHHSASSNDINPTSGLFMTGDFDTEGNIFGADSYDYDYSYDSDLFDTDDFNNGIS